MLIQPDLDEVKGLAQQNLFSEMFLLMFFYRPRPKGVSTFFLVNSNYLLPELPLRLKALLWFMGICQINLGKIILSKQPENPALKAQKTTF